MINFNNQNELLEYLANNSKHYTPKAIIKIIGMQIRNVDFTDKSILETSVGEANLLAELIEVNPTIKKAHITIHDLEEYNINISLQRLNLLGCDNVTSYVGDFMEFNHEENDYYKYDYCFQNPPYGSKITAKVNNYWKEQIGLKKNEFKTPESAFLYKVSKLAKHSFNILPAGCLFRTGWENGVIENTIDMWRRVTLLPPNMFKTTTIPVIIVELKYNNYETLRITDVSDLCFKDGKVNNMNDDHIIETVKIINGGYKDSHLSKLIDFETIKRNNYNLNVTRYIQRVVEEQIDMEALSEEIDNSINELINLTRNIQGDMNVDITEPEREFKGFSELTKQIKGLL